VGLLLLALLVPEAVIGWALRQRQAAAELAKTHRNDGWTIAHGFFAIMGGFMEYEGNQPIRVLLPEELESYSLTGNGDFPRISKAEIEDRSKGDAISKGLVILQTGWFVTQCVARKIQGLPITELELVTVAFAALNFAIYILWWHKPVNVQRGVRVYKKRMTESPVDDGDVEAALGGWVALRDALSELPAAIIRGPFANWDGGPWLVRVLGWPIVRPWFTMIGSDNVDDLEGNRVATFYPAKWATKSEGASILLLGTIAMAFGGIHCIGWSFTFPSNIERTLWRVASLSITGVPIGIVLLGPLADAVDDYLFSDSEIGPFLNIFSSLLCFLYILSRFALLILPLLCLRSLPPAAFHGVHWASFIPHV